MMENVRYDSPYHLARTIVLINSLSKGFDLSGK